MDEPLSTLTAAARLARVTPPTIRSWIEKGWLSPGGPWTAAQVRLAADRGRQRAGRGPVAPHGTPSRYRAGCPCAECLAAHNAESAAIREAARWAWWADREAPLLNALREGGAYAQILEEQHVTAQAVTAHRRRSPDFAAALDEALMDGRDERLDHGKGSAWKAGCRCPECRGYHEAAR